jgi:hypothetical protein
VLRTGHAAMRIMTSATLRTSVSRCGVQAGCKLWRTSCGHRPGQKMCPLCTGRLLVAFLSALSSSKLPWPRWCRLRCAAAEQSLGLNISRGCLLKLRSCYCFALDRLSWASYVVEHLDGSRGMGTETSRKAGNGTRAGTFGVPVVYLLALIASQRS